MPFSFSPLTTEALFHLYFALMFLVLYLKFWLQFKRTGSFLARHLALSFLLGGIQYVVIVISIVFFAYDTRVVKLLDGFVAIVLYSIAVCYSALLTSDLFPKIKSQYIVITSILLGTAMLSINFFSYKPTGINNIGMLDLGLPAATMILVSIQMMLTFVPTCITFAYKSFKKKLYLEGLGLGLGLLMVILFLPLSYQTQSYSLYLFFSTVVVVGFSLIVGTIIIHPLLRINRPSASPPTSPNKETAHLTEKT
jgi:hypothetical protein